MRYFVSLLAFAFMFSAGVPAVRAQSTTDSVVDIQAQIAALLSQVEVLRAKLHTTGSPDPAQQMTKVKIDARLGEGATGEQVRLLQELLASDPSLYPEGLVTGYFGPATEAAVKRFQAKFRIEQAGVVGPQTIARINEILSAAGVTTDIPSDLLRARVMIDIKIKDGKEEIRIKVKEDNSGKGSENSGSDDDDEDEDEDEEDDSDEDENEDEELEIEVEIKDGKAKVKVEQDGDKESFTLRMTDHAEIIGEIAERYDLSESEVEAVIEIEDEDDEDDDDEDDEDDEADDEEEDD